MLEQEQLREQLRYKQGAAFDADYNGFTFLQFYEPSGPFLQLFWDTAYQLSSLHRYLEYARRYLETYLQQGQQHGDLLAAKNTAAEVRYLYEETFLADQTYLLLYQYQAVFLMLYTLYENFLTDLVNLVEAEQGVVFSAKAYRGALVHQYVQFLNQQGKLQIVFDAQTEQQFDWIRKLRNALVHNGGRVDSSGLKKTITAQFPHLIEHDRIVLEYEFLIEAFAVTGAMIAAVEKGYWHQDKE